MKYTIGGLIFSNQEAVKSHVRSVVARYADNIPVSKPDFDFILALLQQHPWADQKIGPGVAQIWIEPTEYGKKGFWLERSDGSTTDFSWMQCLSRPTPLQRFKIACRKAVAQEVIDFSRQFFLNNQNPKCEVLNIPFTKKTSHVDHKAPATFDIIVNDFICERLIDVASVPIVHGIDGIVGGSFADVDLASEWKAFHDKRATLRVISAKGNLTLPKVAS